MNKDIYTYRFYQVRIKENRVTITSNIVDNYNDSLQLGDGDIFRVDETSKFPLNRVEQEIVEDSDIEFGFSDPCENNK
jgi:hypothetical protein